MTFASIFLYSRVLKVPKLTALMCLTNASAKNLKQLIIKNVRKEKVSHCCSGQKLQNPEISSSLARSCLEQKFSTCVQPEGEKTGMFTPSRPFQLWFPTKHFTDVVLHCFMLSISAISTCSYENIVYLVDCKKVYDCCLPYTIISYLRWYLQERIYCVVPLSFGRD